MPPSAPSAKRRCRASRHITSDGGDHGNKSWFPTWGDRNRDVEHFRGFKTQIDTLFEDWFGRSMGGVLAPRVDVAEDERNVMLTAELPGVKEG
jgi:HSP20 family molecular chaperone IbpA